MLDLAKLKQNLVETGAIDEKRLERAQKYAFEENIPLGQALITLNILGHRRLGQAFSEIYELPYASLLNTSPSHAASSVFSSKAAIRWKVVPVAYDESEALLTLAIHDPDQMPKLEKLCRLYILPYTLAFTICSKVELDEAHETCYGTKQVGSPALEKKPKLADQSGKKKMGALHKPTPPGTAPAQSATTHASDSAGAPADQKVPAEAQSSFKSAFSFRGAPKAASDQEPSPTPGGHSPQWKASAKGWAAPSDAPAGLAYKEMSRSLLNAAALLARQQSATTPERLLDAQVRVRYSQLLATRLSCTPVQIDAVLLAAWLSILPNKKDILSEFITPYKLEEVLLTDTPVPGASPRIEARILSLVQVYQDILQRDPEHARDTAWIRNEIPKSWPLAAQNPSMLSAFIQILTDEHFLSKLGKTTGRILIVDPAEMSGAHLAPPLSNDGYEVLVSPDAPAAEEKIAATPPDLCIVAGTLPSGKGLDFCRKLKASGKTARIPCLIVTDQHDDKYLAECLRNGADDVLSLPIDLEVLFLKIQRLMPSDDHDAPSGVKGSLGEMSFTDMIQILSVGNRNVEIVLTKDNQEGRVFIENGSVVHAELGDKEGEAAFYAIMQWKEGEFTTIQCAEFPNHTIHASTMSLLMEGARIADESVGA